MAEKWTLSGSIIGACNCDWGCPCNFDVGPSKGYCDGLYVFAVREGHYGNTSLNGLKFALAGHWPGPVHQGNGTVRIILDDRATTEQRAAIETLSNGGGVGLPWDIFAAVTGTRLPTVYAPIEVKLAGMQTEVKIGGGEMYDLALSRIKNPVTGAEEELYLDKPTGFTAKRTELGMSTVARLATDGLAYDNSGQYAEIGQFEYSGG